MYNQGCKLIKGEKVIKTVVLYSYSKIHFKDSFSIYEDVMKKNVPKKMCPGGKQRLLR